MATVAAGDLGMGPSENGPGFRMVEILGIKRQQTCVRASMFRMAGPATFGLVLVEPPALFDTDGDLLMTGQALSGQDIPFGRVAGRAILDAGLSGVGSAQGARGVGNVGFLKECGERRVGCRPNHQGGN
jgi:hypothetical protein